MLHRLGLSSLPRQRVAVELTEHRLRAVAAVVDDRAGLRLTATVVRDRPMDLEDDAALAAWIEQSLDDVGIPRVPCIVSVPREQVVLKRLELPGGSGDDLPAMAELAASRELPIDPATAVIDSLPVHEDEDAAEVLAAAIPQDDLDAVRQRMKAAGRPARVVTLRLFGAEALAPGQGSHVVVDVSGSHVEVLWVDNGEPRRARGASLQSTELDARLGGISLEVRRTWLAWRAEGEGPAPAKVYLSGPDDVVDGLVEPVQAITGATAVKVDAIDGVDTGRHQLQEVRSMVGLLVAEATNRDWIDLNAPRKSPDRNAKRRQFALLGLLGLIVLLGTIWAIGMRTQAGLKQQLSNVQTTVDRLEDPWWRYNRDTFKAGHLELWTATGPDVGADLATVLKAIGPPGDVLVDELVISVDLQPVDADKGTVPKDWTLAWSERLVIDAEASSRDEAEALRGRLAETEPWTVSTSGPDAADGRRLPHDLTLRLDRSSSPEDEGL